MIDAVNNIPSPTDEPSSWTPLLTAILDEQDESTAELESLSEQQTELIDRSATDDLLRLLGQRQRLLDSALTTAKRLEPFTENWDAFMGALPALDREGFVSRVRMIQDRIDRISARDESTRTSLVEQRNTLTEELASVGNSRGAMAAYTGKSNYRPSPRFQDREC